MNKYVLIIIILFIIYLISIEIKKKLIYAPLSFIPQTYTAFYQEISEIIYPYGKLEEFYIQHEDRNIYTIMISHPKIKKYVLIFNKGSGNMTELLPYIRLLSNHVNIIAFDYNGFGRSSNAPPSEQSFKENAITVWNYLTQELELEPENISIFGEEIGSSVAIWLTGFLSNSYNIYPNSLIIQSAFTSLKSQIPNYPIINMLKYVFKNEYNSSENIKKINNEIPILFIHNGTENSLVLYHQIMADRIYNQKINFISFHGYDQDYANKLLKFI